MSTPFIMVVTALAQHRRAGISFARGVSLIPADQLSPTQHKALLADPHLRVAECSADDAEARCNYGGARQLNLAPAATSAAPVSPEQIRAAIDTLALTDGDTPTAKAVNGALKAQGVRATVKVADIQAALNSPQ